MLDFLNIFLLFSNLYIFTRSKKLQSSFYNYLRRLNSEFENSITLIVNGPGDNIRILSNEYEKSLPSEIYINDSPLEEISRTVNLIKEGDNIIKMKWTKSLSSTSNMFANCDSIISADLSKLDCSKIAYMKSMFGNCTSLQFVNLSNLNIEKDLTF